MPGRGCPSRRAPAKRRREGHLLPGDLGTGPVMPALEVRNLSKRYGRTVAVDDLSFAVEAGRVTGFLGPNGAGKTTTMRALLGLLRPSAGEALVEGSPPVEMGDPLRTIGAAPRGG